MFAKRQTWTGDKIVGETEVGYSLIASRSTELFHSDIFDYYFPNDCAIF